MARTYKRDSRGRFAGGGGGGSGGGGRRGGSSSKGGKGGGKGGGSKGTIAERKRAMNKEVTAASLLGKGTRNPQRERYIGAQNRSAYAATKRGKGNKAARRAAAVMAAAAAKPKRGAPKGPRGGKVGTASQQRTAARKQAARQKAFSSKATTGRGAKAAYDAARSNARADRRAERMGGGRARGR